MEDSQSHLNGLLDVYLRVVSPGVWLITSRGSLLFLTFESKFQISLEAVTEQMLTTKKGLKMVPDDLTRHVSWPEMSAHFESPFTKSQQGAHSASLPLPLSLYSDSQTRFQAKVHHSNNSYPLLPNTKKCHTDHRLQPLLNYDVI